jgi:hypothetical protein
LINAARVKDTTPERLMQWFDELKKAIEEYDIKPENMYNIDKSGFSVGEVEASRRIINAIVYEAFQAKPGQQEWVTLVECISMDGSALPLLIIFKAENLSQ